MIVLKLLKNLMIKELNFTHQKKISLYAARNEAILKAKGSFIAFLDTDDWWKKINYQSKFYFYLKIKKQK